jgi:peptidoglycan/xylan/chitin deacetylase (PgdA/CDA1 family)
VKRIPTEALAFGAPAIAVVVISAMLTLRRGEAVARPQPARFSGSVVVQRLPSLLAWPRLHASLAVVVVRDEAAISFYNSPVALDSIVTAWRTALEAVGATVQVMSSTAARAQRSANVFVVPSSPCLTVATRETIEAAAARGAGLILTSAAGTYDAGCRPLGYGLIVGQTGAARAEALESRGMTYVTFPSTSPLTSDIPPGARLDLNPGRQVALRHPTRDAFYSDYALQPRPARDEPLLDGALTHTSDGGRRVVYWGFELADVVNRPWDRAISRLLVRNSLAWAAGQPLSTVEPWPLGKRAAASIAQDVESGFENARHAADSLRAAGVRSTFFLTSELAQHYVRLSRRLAQSGEIGTHGETHRLLGGLTPDEQHARLALTQQDLKDLVGAEVSGLRPPEEQFDTATMTAWMAVKGSYLFGANDSRAAAPELFRVGDDTLVLVARIGSDDIAAAARRVTAPDSLTSIFLNEYERVRALGGHYVLSYHSQLLARPDLVPSLARVARRLASDTAVWVATVSEVADWWRARSLVETRARVTSDRLRVVVHNKGNRMLSGAVVRVAVPDAKRVVRSDARLLPGHDQMLRLAIPPIPANATKTFTVTFGR